MTLRRSAFSAGRWTTFAAVFRAGIQVVQAMVLARMLIPADFGLMAIAGAAYAIVAIFVDMGLASALIHFSQPSKTVLSTLYWLNLSASAVLMLLFAGLAWPLAEFYGEPALLPVLLVMSIALPLGAIGYQFRVMAEKELRFSTLAVIEIVAASGGFLVAVVVALQGGGVYALVAAILMSTCILSGSAWIFLSQGIRPGFRFSLAEVYPYLRYGGYRLGDALFNNLRMQLDVLLGGGIVGAAAMGIYSVPRDLTLRLANSIVNPVVTRVGLPLMAKVQGDIAALRSVYLQTLRMTASINFPTYMVLAVWSEEAIALLLGPQWQDAGIYMRLFSIWAMIRSVGNPTGSLLYATGHVRLAFWWNLAQLMLMPAFLLVGARLDGTLGLAWAMLWSQVLAFYLSFRFLVYPVCGASFSEYMAPLYPPLVASLLAAGLGFMSCLLITNTWFRLSIGIVVSTLTYLWVSWMINRQWVASMLELVRPIIRFRA